MKKTFTEYLKEVHAKSYQGTDDNMPDAFDKWFDKKNVDEIIEFAEEWVRDLIK